MKIIERREYTVVAFVATYPILNYVYITLRKTGRESLFGQKVIRMM